MKQGEIDGQIEDYYLGWAKPNGDLLHGTGTCGEIPSKRKDRAEVGRDARRARQEVTTRWKKLRRKVLYRTQFGRTLRGIKDLCEGYGMTYILQALLYGTFFCGFVLMASLIG